MFQATAHSSRMLHLIYKFVDNKTTKARTQVAMYLYMYLYSHTKKMVHNVSVINDKKKIA